MAFLEVRGKNADYIIVFGGHFSGNRSEIQRFIAEADAIVLEQRTFENIDFLKSMRQKRMVGELEASKKSLPVYLTDVAPLPGINSTNAVGAARLVGGTVLMGKGFFEALEQAKKKLRKKPVSRREFLEKIAKAGAYFAAGGTISNAIPAATLELPGKIGSARERMRKGIVFSEQKLGEIRLSQLRDAINAIKIDEFVAPQIQKQTGRRPKITLFGFSANHAAIADMLQNPKTARKILARERNALKNLETESIPEIRRFDFQKGEWNTTDYRFDPIPKTKLRLFRRK